MRSTVLWFLTCETRKLPFHDTDLRLRPRLAFEHGGNVGSRRAVASTHSDDQMSGQQAGCNLHVGGGVGGIAGLSRQRAPCLRGQLVLWQQQPVRQPCASQYEGNHSQHRRDVAKHGYPPLLWKAAPAGLQEQGILQHCEREQLFLKHFLIREEVLRDVLRGGTSVAQLTERLPDSFVRSSARARRAPASPGESPKSHRRARSPCG